MISIRPLADTDIECGYLDLLRQLTDIGYPSPDAIRVQVQRLRSLYPILQVWVGVDETGALIASGTLIIEPKLIHGCSAVAHIEDVVVHSAARGKGVAKKIVGHLAEIAAAAGCYKIVLNCQPEVARVYESCGFAQPGVIQMRRDI
jgi:glucosamine-phosphate N-acetyltransferase